MELVCIDFLTLERSKGGFEKILVITDHFIRYAQAFPTRNAKTTAKVLFENFIVQDGFPARLHSDQGRNFESSVIQEPCRLAGVEKSRTTLYRPIRNCMVERFNQTLLNMLGTIENHKKEDWKSYVARWPTPIMPPNTPVRAIPHIFSCLGDIRGWQSMHI